MRVLRVKSWYGLIHHRRNENIGETKLWCKLKIWGLSDGAATTPKKNRDKYSS
jgi:hypothetical protein